MIVLGGSTKKVTMQICDTLNESPKCSCTLSNIFTKLSTSQHIPDFYASA